MVHASAGKKKTGKGNDDEDASALMSEGFSSKSGKGHAKDLPCQKAGKLKPGKLGNEEEDRVKAYVKEKLERRGLCLYASFQRLFEAKGTGDKAQDRGLALARRILERQ